MATPRRRPGSFPLAQARTTQESSRLANYSIVDPLAELKQPNLGANNRPASESETSDQSFPIGASYTTRGIVAPVHVPSSEPYAIEQVGAGEGTLHETEPIEISKSQEMQVSDSGQQWVTGAIEKEGLGVSLTKGQDDRDPTLQVISSNNEKARDTVQLEAGDEGSATPEDAAKDPGKDRIVNVVVWFGPTDPEVSGLFLLRAIMINS